MKRNKSAQQCVVCGSRMPHHPEPSVVGRHPSGRARLLCWSRSCRKAWADPVRRADIMARWVENRDE